MKVRKKPVVVEAFHFKWGSSILEARDFCEEKAMLIGGDLLIETLEGYVRCDVDDYIIKGVEGEFYPCKPQIFKKTYDILEDE
ncbi:hypothetical protein [Enterococcus sp. DIV0800]|uniref:hypothetical protein n=1 Tax=unclassified Enterococcus TaxID=2608891 RepID=UPI003D300516